MKHKYLYKYIQKKEKGKSALTLGEYQVLIGKCEGVLEL